MGDYTVSEMIADLLDSASGGIRYWAETTLRGGVLTVVEHEDGRTRTVSPGDVRRWAAGDGPAGLVIRLGDQYQKAAVIGIAAAIRGVIADPLAVDWDEETADVIVQWIVLGGVVYG